MRAYEFFSTPENGCLPIPEQFREQIKTSVKVIVLEERDTRSDIAADSRPKSARLLPPSLDTIGWRFNREEANER